MEEKSNTMIQYIKNEKKYLQKINTHTQIHTNTIIVRTETRQCKNK